MTDKIENIRAMIAKLQESASISSSSLSRSKRSAAIGRASVSKNKAASAESSAVGNASKTMDKPSVSSADSVSISAKADRLSRMQRPSGAEMSVGQDEPNQKPRVDASGTEKTPERSMFQGFLSFVKTIMEQRASAGEINSKPKDAAPGNTPVDQDKAKSGFAAEETLKSSGPGPAWAGKVGAESKDPVQGTEASDRWRSPNEGPVKGSENGAEASSGDSPINRQGAPLLSKADEKIGYFGDDGNEETERSNPLRDFIQKTREGQTTAGGLLNGVDQILEKAEKTTDPLGKMAEKLEEQPALNGNDGLLSKLNEQVDKIAEKAEKDADKIEKDEKKDDKEDVRVVSDALKKRVINERKIEEETSSKPVREEDSNKGQSKKIDEEEDWKPRETKRNPESTDRVEQSELRSRPDYGMEIFGPYFAGISDGVAGAGAAESSEQASMEQPVEQPVVGLKGVVHVKNENGGSSAVETGTILHIGARADKGPAANTVGNFSFAGAESNSLGRALFDMRKGISAYRSVDEMFG